MRLDFLGTCPKEPGADEANEDHAELAPDGARFAMCDGASESYDSRLWARIVARRFVGEPGSGFGWLDLATDEYRAAHDLDALSWSRRASFDKGSFSTLLGVAHDEQRDEAVVVAVGDSVALVVDGDRFVGSWLYQSHEAFKERPTLLSTAPEHNAFAFEPEFAAAVSKPLALGSFGSPKLLCMTDALGEWALRRTFDGEPGVEVLLALRSAEELRALVADERGAGRMRVDDSTLAVLSFGHTAQGDAIPLP